MSNDEARETLRKILEEVDTLIEQTVQSREELAGIQADLDKFHGSGDVSVFGYDIRSAQVLRAKESTDWCIQRLERQRKLAFYQLQALEKDQ